MTPVQAVQLISQVTESTPLIGQDRDNVRQALQLLAQRSDELDAVQNPKEKSDKPAEKPAPKKK